MAAQTHQLPPAASIGMAIGADIAKADPAMICTRGMGAEMARGIDVAVATSGEPHARWRRTGRLRVRPDVLLTQRAIRPESETRKWFGIALGPRRFWPCWSALAAPTNLLEQENEKKEENANEWREIQVESHDQPSLRWSMD